MSKTHRGMLSEDGFAPSYIPSFTTPEKYIEARVNILEQLGIYLTEEDIQHLPQFKTEYAIDAAIKTVINRHWK